MSSLWAFLRVTIGICVFCADGIMITNNSNDYYVFLNVFMFRIMSMTLRNINPRKEIFHHYDFPVYTTSKYRDPKLDTYRRITRMCLPDFKIPIFAIPNFVPIYHPSIFQICTKKNHQIFLKLGAFYHHLLKIHPIYVNCVPSSVTKTLQSLYQIPRKRAEKAGA